MLKLPNVTLLIIDCHNLSRALTSLSHSMRHIEFGQVKLLSSLEDLNIPEPIKLVKIPEITSIQAYSKFMIKDLYNYVDTEFVLCTQWDAWILNPDAWMQDFLKYDYIGAPWWFNEEKNVGNGGFSLRSKKFLHTTANLMIKNFHPEDLVLCRTYRSAIMSNGCIFAPEDIAARFSIEGNIKYGKKWTNQFGFHDLEMTDISEWKPKIQDNPLKIIYKICDKRLNTYYKDITKLDCLSNFISIFGTKDIIVLADNCSKDMIQTLSNFKLQDIREYKLGNAGIIAKSINIALSFPDYYNIYTVEDDYLHHPDSLKIIKEGLEISDFVTLYDHPDKYLSSGPNPLVSNGGEIGRILLTNSCHWKETNSTTMTFATTVKTLRETQETMNKYLKTSIGQDYPLWRDILKSKTLISSIPGYSTHCHEPWITPLRSW